MLPAPSAINPVSVTHINTQLRYALTHRLSVAKISGFNLAEPGSNAGFRNFVPKRRDPLDERRTSILISVVDEFDHKNKCSIKATRRSSPKAEAIGVAKHIVIERVLQTLVFQIVFGVDAYPLGKDAVGDLPGVEKSCK